MKPRLKRKIILLTLVFCFVFSSVFAETLIAGSIEHECTGTMCLICLKIEMTKSLKLASVILFFAGCLMFSAMIPKICKGFNDCSLSPVELRVRSNS